MYDWAEFRHFRYLLTILEKQGFRAAADVLHTSQPNLTVQARQFQENASIHLLRKSKDGRIRPTETGVPESIFLGRYLVRKTRGPSLWRWSGRRRNNFAVTCSN
jgi:hypothetical protein